MSGKKVAMITAGGSGMGADAARRLHADGVEVAILSASGKGEALASELGGVGHTGSNLETESFQALADKAMERWGRIDIVINSAGHGPKGAVLDISDEDWHTAMEVYLLNCIRPTRIVTPIMQAQGGGAIINISTFAVFEPGFAVSDVGRVPCFACRFCETVRRQICRRQHPYEQRPARLHRQLAGNRGSQGPHSDGSLRPHLGGFGNDRLSGIRQCRLRHRTELPDRRWSDPERLT